MNEAIACACGGITGSVVPKGAVSGVCHCVTCRKWSGGAFMAVSCEDVRFDDEAALHVWVSSEWGERVSCGKCGSALVWRTRDGSHQSVSVQAFADPAGYPLASEIFIDDKPGSYAFVGDHERLSRAEVMARYADGKEAQ